eukprot:gnl/TRDRNA2_/TRDRNA2_177760_c2_seq1.p1 gnl/TRDRNA2_/TRDRNA2_177760_c2~~gnl/TRDRNA2_/TRDRNA2_177760_c2_seq1.p1  ORF type:complete len:279 (-),score=67.35 gnl/TRDRNA2_/TRDRNA2_177760_c2_seq1:52-888(-)
MQLQDLAHLAGVGVQFDEGRGQGHLRFTIAGDGYLQYSVDGAWRPPFREMAFEEDGLISFSEIHKKAQLPKAEASALSNQLQQLANLAGTGVKSNEGSENNYPAGVKSNQGSESGYFPGLPPDLNLPEVGGSLTKLEERTSQPAPIGFPSGSYCACVKKSEAQALKAKAAAQKAVQIAAMTMLAMAAVFAAQGWMFAGGTGAIAASLLLLSSDFVVATAWTRQKAKEAELVQAVRRKAEEDWLRREAEAESEEILGEKNPKSSTPIHVCSRTKSWGGS